ncbi:MAG: energy transducer TonB [Bacteroides sp.]|nr:energy transducer TonB [Bacteroides sp.]
MRRLSFILLLILTLPQLSVAQQTNKEVMPNDTTIYCMYIVDQQARLSSEKLNKHLQANLQYPKYAYQKGVEGTVYVRFAVEKDGSITNVKVRKGVNPELDAEAIKVVSTMPKWEPGKNKGIIVRTRHEYPVKFKKLN